MTFARFLRASALEALREEVPMNLDRYRTATHFVEFIEDPKLSFPVHVEIDTTLLDNLQASEPFSAHEVENCLRVHEALKGLTLYDARDERLWAYLCHVHCLEYSRDRWPIPEDDDKAVAHIRLHFFAKSDRQIERDNALSRLWWMAELCSRIEQMDVSDALEILLLRTDARAQIIERPTLSQNTQILAGILEALKPYKANGDGLFVREINRRFVQDLNSIGGYKLLDVLPEPHLDAILKDVADTAIGSTTQDA